MGGSSGGSGWPADDAVGVLCDGPDRGLEVAETPAGAAFRAVALEVVVTAQVLVGHAGQHVEGGDQARVPDRLCGRAYRADRRRAYCAARHGSLLRRAAISATARWGAASCRRAGPALSGTCRPTCAWPGHMPARTPTARRCRTGSRRRRSCDTRSHIASELMDRRSDDVGRVASSGRVLDVRPLPGRASQVPPVGVRSPGMSPRIRRPAGAPTDVLAPAESWNWGPWLR